MQTIELNTKVDYVVWDETSDALHEIIDLVGMDNVTFGSSTRDTRPGLIIGDPLKASLLDEGDYIVRTPWGIQVVKAIDMEAFLMDV